MKAMRELDFEEMGKIAGGFIFLTTDYCEVIDDRTGEVINRFPAADVAGAKHWAWEHGISTDGITWSDLNGLRNEARAPLYTEVPFFDGDIPFERSII